MVDIVFLELLDKIYEQPIKTKKHLDLLKQKVIDLSKNNFLDIVTG